MTFGAFGVVSALGQHGESLDGYRGLAGRRPLVAALMLLFLLALAGIPPTAGFMAKFAVIGSCVRAGHVPLAVLAVACAVVSAFVYLRVAVLMYMADSQEPEPARTPAAASAATSAALAVAGLVTLLGGVFPESLMRWVKSP
jgi:NADH-quinone oxidoreductase subunit N